MSEGLLKTAVGVPWNLGLLTQEASDSKPSLDPTHVSQRWPVEIGLSCCPLLLSSGPFLEGTHLWGPSARQQLCPVGPKFKWTAGLSTNIYTRNWAQWAFFPLSFLPSRGSY